MEIIDWIGFGGTGVILLAFFMNQTHRWSSDDLIYDSSNLLGGLLLVYYAFVGEAWPFVILNGVWSLVSLRDVLQSCIRNRHAGN